MRYLLLVLFMASSYAQDWLTEDVKEAIEKSKKADQELDQLVAKEKNEKMRICTRRIESKLAQSAKNEFTQAQLSYFLFSHFTYTSCNSTQECIDKLYPSTEGLLIDIKNPDYSHFEIKFKGDQKTFSGHLYDPECSTVLNWDYEELKVSE